MSRAFKIATGAPFTWLFGIAQSYEAKARIERPDQAELQAHWTQVVTARDHRTARAETIGRAYDGAVTRAVRVEAKAVGLLQVVAIIFAVIALVLPRRTTSLRVLLIVSVVYLAAATWGALEVLRVREQRQVLAHTAESESGGLVETAVAAAELQILGVGSANFIAGMLRDLVVAAAAAAMALILVVWGVGGPSPSTAPSSQMPPTSTTTTIASPTTRAAIAPQAPPQRAAITVPPGRAPPSTR